MGNIKTTATLLISSAQKILITAHYKPDADAIASMISTHYYFTKLYPKKQVDAAISAHKSNNWAHIPGTENIIWINDIVEIVENYDLIIFLDGSTYDRFSYATDFGKRIEDIKKICFDHHKSQVDKFDYAHIDTSATAVSQIVYEQFFAKKYASDFEKIEANKNTAAAVIFGILGDTGGLTFIGAHNARVLAVVQQILEKYDLDIQKLSLDVQRIPERVYKLMQRLVNNSENVKVYLKSKKENLRDKFIGFSYSFLPAKVLDKYSTDEIRMAKDTFQQMFLRKIGKYSWGYIVTPSTKQEFSVSFRSTPGMPNVRYFAEMFDGGGHDLAAAAKYKVHGRSRMDSREVSLEVINVIKKEAATGRLQLTF